nr:MULTISPECIES: hypothetical protein [unclassified Ruegeria]
MVLKGKEQHELSCSSCGAPLHNLKMVPKEKLKKKPEKLQKYGGNPNVKRKKKKKSMFSRFIDEAWDIVEDVFD